MKERRVVIVAYPGLQPLDVVGPYEVFVGATRVLAATGQSGGYQVTLASVSGKPVRAESGLELGTAPLPDPSERIDTVILPGGNGSRAGPWPSEAGVSPPCVRAPSWAPRPVSWTAAA
jgi:putative intracellular protease/amidase